MADAASNLQHNASDMMKDAETGAWDQALDACSKAHEMLPDDLGLEHAYQQAKAASGN